MQRKKIFNFNNRFSKDNIFQVKEKLSLLSSNNPKQKKKLNKGAYNLSAMHCYPTTPVNIICKCKYLLKNKNKDLFLIRIIFKIFCN